MLLGGVVDDRRAAASEVVFFRFAESVAEEVVVEAKRSAPIDQKRLRPQIKWISTVGRSRKAQNVGAVGGQDFTHLET